MYCICTPLDYPLTPSPSHPLTPSPPTSPHQQCASVAPIELVVNVDSPGEHARWAALAMNTTLPSLNLTVVPVFSPNLHEARAYNRAAMLARGRWARAGMVVAVLGGWRWRGGGGGGDSFVHFLMWSVGLHGCSIINYVPFSMLPSFTVP